MRRGDRLLRSLAGERARAEFDCGEKAVATHFPCLAVREPDFVLCDAIDVSVYAASDCAGEVHFSATEPERDSDRGAANDIFVVDESARVAEAGGLDFTLGLRIVYVRGVKSEAPPCGIG